MDDLDALERRVDRLEQRNVAEDAVAQAESVRTSKRHTNWQLVMAVISTLTMLVNLYLSVSSHK